MGDGGHLGLGLGAGLGAVLKERLKGGLSQQQFGGFWRGLRVQG